jgi:putative membrane protein
MLRHLRTTERRDRRSILSGPVLGVALAVIPVTGMAHSGPPPVPETLWSTWNFDPFVMLVLALAITVYLRGVRAIWARAGRGRGIRQWQVASVLGGYLAIAIALISPLDPLSSALFSAHMGQHLFLITIAPLLLIVGDVSSASIWGLPSSWRRALPGMWRSIGPVGKLWAIVTLPLIALAIHSLVLWIWHIPAFYNAAVRNELIHALEHLTMFLTAALFWWVVLQRGRQAAMNYGIGILMLFGLVLQKTALGALISFSSNPWYSEYATSTASWGITPIEDQQLAGAVLMAPGGFIYLVIGVVLFAGWFRAIERSVDRDDELAGFTSSAEHAQVHRMRETV